MYCNFPRCRHPKNCCNYPEIWTMWPYHRVVSPKKWRRNGKQCRPWSKSTALLGAIWSLGLHCLLRPIRSLRYSTLSFALIPIVIIFEPPRDKTNKMTLRPAKTQISLGIRPVWSESLLSAWRKLGSLATNWSHSEDSDQTGQMPRLIRVFAGHTLIVFVLSWDGSFGVVGDVVCLTCCFVCLCFVSKMFCTHRLSAQIKTV